ncbi:MAG: NeuD/PglB/VioB family sugar acetyltransferase [Bacteroidota bacterium]
MAETLVYILGAGGHAAKALNNLLRSLDKESGLKVAGFISNEHPGTISHRGYPVLFSFNTVPDWLDLSKALYHSAVGDMHIRRQLAMQAEALGMRPVPAIGPNTYIADDNLDLGGAFMGAGSVIETGCSIGKGLLLDTHAVLEHDCTTGDYVNISPNATVCGGVRIGSGTVIGAGAVVREKITIGGGALIGAGAVVLSHIPDFAVAYGVPAKVIRYRQPGDKIYK